ncbi:MAG TPA: hypothetical protein VF037_01085, partial [Gemmatimonadales bacterium]
AYRFAVAPFEFAPLVLDALARWDGVSLVDERQMAADGSGQGDSDRARAAAHGAGRLIRGQVERAGAEVRISAQLLDTRTGELLARHAVRAPAGGSPDSAVAALADELVLLAAGRPADAGLRNATRSLPARYALARGLRAVNAWDLRAAADDFSDAARLDPRFGQALLWDALARAWSGAPAAAWRSSAERAHALEAGLSPRERIVAAAAVAMSRDDMVTACAHWARLARDNPGDFIAWYGWGDCLSRDDTVLRDPASASGWRFRTSYHAALRAYQRALQLQPSVHEGLSAGGFEPVSTLFKLRPTSARFGRSATAGQARFLALPGWVADTLVFVPWPLSEFRTPPTLLEAVQHQRELFHEIATGWTTALPSSPTALVALAHAIELLGQPGARETIERARKLAATPTDSFRAASQLVWVRLRLAAPHDPAGVAAASALADTLLARSGEVPVDPLALASLAALRGRTGAAIAGISQPDVRLTLEVPPGLFPAAPRLLLHAALGSPADTLRRLEREVAEAIDRSIPPRDRAAAREAWIARAVTLAFPGVRLEGAEAGGDYLLAALRALARGDSTAARAMLAAGLGTSGPLAERPADALFPEAWLLAASGDTVAAVAWLDRLLGSLYGKAARAASDPVEAAALVQAMQLRADLAAATGDTVAANAWGTTVRILRAD